MQQLFLLDDLFKKPAFSKGNFYLWQDNSHIQHCLQVFMKINFFNAQLHLKLHSSATIFNSILAQHMLERYLVCQIYPSLKKSLLKDTYYRQGLEELSHSLLCYLALQIHLSLHKLNITLQCSRRKLFQSWQQDPQPDTMDSLHLLSLRKKHSSVTEA